MNKIKKIIYITLSIVVVTTLVAFFIIRESKLGEYTVEQVINWAIKKDAKISFENLNLHGLIDEAEFRNLTVTLHTGEVIKVKYLHAKFDLLSVIDGFYDLDFALVDSAVVITDGSTPGTRKREFFSLYNEIYKTDLDINLLQVKNSRLITNRKKGYDFTDINYKGKFTFLPEKIDIQVDHFSAKWESRDIDIKSLSMLVSGDESAMNINQFRTQINETDMIGKGRMGFNSQNDYQFYLDDVYLKNHDFKFLTKVLEYPGYFKFRSEISGDKNGFDTKFFLDSALVDQIKFDKSTINAYYKNSKKELWVKESRIKANDGIFKINGNILGESNDYTVYFNKLDLEKFFISKISSNLNGYAKVHQSEIDFTGKSIDNNRLYLGNSRFGKTPIKKGFIKFDNDTSTFYLYPSSNLSFQENSKFNITGTIFGRNREMSITATSDSASTIKTLQAIEFMPFDGKIESNIKLIGSLDNPDLQATLYSDKLSIGRIDLLSVNIETDLKDVFYKRSGDIAVYSDSISLAGLGFKSFQMTSTMQEDTLEMHDVQMKTEKSLISFHGKYLPSLDKNLVVIPEINIAHDEYKINSNDTLTISILDSLYQFSELDFHTKSGGKIRTNGYYINDGSNRFVFDVDNIDLESFNPFINYKHNFKGTANGKVIFNDINNLDFRANLDIDTLIVLPKDDKAIFERINRQEVSFGKVTTQLEYKNDNLKLNQVSVIDGDSRLNLTGDAQFFVKSDKTTETNSTEVDIETRFENIDIQKYNIFIGYYKELNGFVDGYIHYQGNVNNPYGQINIKSDKLKINELTYKGDIQTTFSNNYWDFDSVSVFINESNVLASGRKKLSLSKDNFWDFFSNDTIDFIIQSSGESITAIHAITPDVMAIKGDYNIILSIQGTVDKPSITDGTISLKNADMFLEKLGNPIQNVTFDAYISESVMKINTFTGKTRYYKSSLLGFAEDISEGTIDVVGEVNLTEMLHPKVDLSIDLNSFYANYYKENAEVVINGKGIKVVGRDTLYASGEVEVEEGDVYFDYDIDKKTAHDVSEELSERFLVMDFMIKVNERLRIHNEDKAGIRGFDMYLITKNENRFQFQKNADGSKIYRGIVEIDQGSFTSLFQTFEIEKGILNFTQKDDSKLEFNPFVDFAAIYETEKYKFRIIFSDYFNRFSNLNIEIYDQNTNQRLEKSEDQIVNLLLFGEENFSSLDLGNFGSTGINFLSTFFRNSILSSLPIESISLSDRDNEVEQAQTSIRYRIKTSRILLGKNLSFQGKLNNRFIENVGFNYKLSDSFRIQTNYNDYFLFNDENNRYQNMNLKLKWYYEF